MVVKIQAEFWVATLQCGPQK